MARWSILIAATAAFVLADIKEAVAQPEFTRFRVHAEAGVKGYPGGGASRLQLTVRYRFVEQWYLDVVGKTGGVHRGLGWAGDDHLYNAIAVGPGFSTGEEPDGWEFRISPRFTHIHHTTTDNWRDDYWTNLIADSSGDVEHRSGAELALGVTGPRFFRVLERELIWSGDIMFSVLPTSDIMRFGAGFVLGLSVGNRITAGGQRVW